MGALKTEAERADEVAFELGYTVNVKEKDADDVYELKDVTVVEVSLVDNPAIGREILLTKREGDMAKLDKEEEEEETTEEPRAEGDPAPEAEAEAEADPKEEPIVKPTAKAEPEPKRGAKKPGRMKAEPEPKVDEEPEEEPSVPSVFDAIGILAQRSEELPMVARAAISILERHVVESEDKEAAQRKRMNSTDFNEVLGYMSLPGMIWASFDSLVQVVWTILDQGEEDEQLSLIDTAIGDFQKSLHGILSEAGVKVEEPESKGEEEEPEAKGKAEAEAEPEGEVQLGDEGVKVKGADEFQTAVITAMHAMATAIADLRDQVGEIAARGGAEVAQKQEVQPEPAAPEAFTPEWVMKRINVALEQAKRPRYKAISHDPEDTDVDAVEKREAEPRQPKQDEGHPGLAGLKRVEGQGGK